MRACLCMFARVCIEGIEVRQGGLSLVHAYERSLLLVNVDAMLILRYSCIYVPSRVCLYFFRRTCESAKRLWNIRKVVWDM